ncbi:MAG: hydrolase [Candidatus Micrarchaeia archaeon]
MPFTPFHLGPALLLGMLLFNYVSLPALIISSVITDLEPLAVLLLGLNYPTHGFFHSLLGGTATALFLFFIMSATDKEVQKLMSRIKLQQKHSKGKILLGCLFGVYSHILLDSSLGYPDIKPLFPFEGNPFSSLTYSEVYLLCTLSFFLGLALCIDKIRK